MRNFARQRIDLGIPVKSSNAKVVTREELRDLMGAPKHIPKAPATTTEYRHQVELEQPFQNQVEAELKLTRLLWLHIGNSTMNKGDKGFSDIFAKDPLTGLQLAWELKREGEDAKPEQIRWLDAFWNDGITHVAVYHPSDIGTIRAILALYRIGRLDDGRE